MAKTSIRKPTQFEYDVVTQLLREYASKKGLQTTQIIEILEHLICTK